MMNTLKELQKKYKLVVTIPANQNSMNDKVKE
jgi:hypothetical protein